MLTFFSSSECAHDGAKIKLHFPLEQRRLIRDCTMPTCSIALGEPAQIRGSISKMKMDIQKKKWTVIRQNMC